MNKKRELFGKLEDKSYEEFLIKEWQYSSKENFIKYLGSNSHYSYFMRYLKKNYPWLKKKDRVRCDRKILHNLNFMNYFYGVMTDAYYSLSNRAIQMEVMDQKWLEGLYNYIKPDSFLIFRNGRKYSIGENNKGIMKDSKIMIVRDIEFVQACLDHGMERARIKNSNALIMPDEGYEYEFIKGLMDANGSVNFDGREKKSIGNIWFFSTKAQIEWLYNFLNNDGIKTHKIKDRGNLYQLSLNKNESIFKLIERIHKNDRGFSLKRKRDKCLKIIEVIKECEEVR